LPGATLAVAAPGNQSGLAPHQVRLHFADIDWEEKALTGDVPYEINLGVWRDSLSSPRQAFV
jgi:hypothetical protein